MEEDFIENQPETIAQKPKKGFSVTFEDGTVIHESTSVGTFIKSLQKIGLKRINESQCPEHSKYKVVDTREKTGSAPEQKKVVVNEDGVDVAYYVYTSLKDGKKSTTCMRFPTI